MTMVLTAIYRGFGDSKSPMKINILVNIMNVCGNFLMIFPTREITVLGVSFTMFGCGWGVAGAAWATIIGQAASFVFSIAYLYKRKAAFGFDFRRESFTLNRRYSSMILKLGTPMAIQSGFINLSMLFVNAMINDAGVVASATFGVGVRIDDIINKISQGIQYAAMPMISQNDGAGNQKRMKSVVYYAWVYSFLLTAVFMLLYLLLGKELFMLFSDDTLVHEMSDTFIKAILWMFPAFALMRGSGAFISGIGNVKLSMILAMLDGVVLRIGLSWLFGIVFNLGFFGFVLGYALAPYGFAIPSTVYFLLGKWHKRKALANDI